MNTQTDQQFNYGDTIKVIKEGPFKGQIGKVVKKTDYIHVVLSNGTRVRFRDGLEVISRSGDSYEVFQVISFVVLLLSGLYAVYVALSV